MPNISVPLTEISQSVSRPIILDIIKQVQSITNIPTTAKIIFAGDAQTPAQPGSAIDDTNRQSMYASGSYIEVVVLEDYDPDTLGNVMLSKTEQIPIFADPALDVYIKPAYATTDVTISFKYRTTSKTDALKWRGDVRMRASQMRTINLHSIHYHYTIPRSYLVLLKEIHALRESVAGYGQTFQAYLLSNASTRLTEVGNLSGTYSEMAISEQQSKIQGVFDFQGAPDKIEKDTENATWVVSFDYKFSYERPEYCNIVYPISVHNQMLPALYVIPSEDSYDLDNINASYPKSLESLHRFEAQDQITNRINTKSIIHIPMDDGFIPDATKPGTATVVWALCTVDTDGKALLNLGDLGDYALDADILDFILKSEYPFINKDYASVMQVELYRFKYLTSNKTITCANTGSVSAVAPLDLRKVYHVRISIVTDITKLDVNAIARLRMYPKAFLKIIFAINEAFRNLPGVDGLGEAKYITAQNFTSLYLLMTGMLYNNTSEAYMLKNGYTLPIDTANLNGVYLSSTALKNRYDGVYDPNDIFRDIRGDTLENIRQNAVRQKTVLSSYIVAPRQR